MMFFRNPAKERMPSQTEALPGRAKAIEISNQHFVLKNPLKPPYPQGLEKIVFGLGCFWGAEKRFWSLPGVYTTAVGYSAGYTENPTYEEVCSGMTGHNEVVLVVFDPKIIELTTLLKVFWESHNPTQGMRQGNDRGTQYRSGIYVYDERQKLTAEHSQKSYQVSLKNELNESMLITTEIQTVKNFYFAEDYHQQYLAKNPNGYCGLGGTGVSYCVQEKAVNL